MSMTRRNFVKASAAGVAALALFGCQSQASGNAGNAGNANNANAAGGNAHSDAQEGAAAQPESILARMNVRQKIAQVMMPSLMTWDGVGDTTTLSASQQELLREFEFGGVIIFGQNTMESTKATVDLVKQITASTEAGAAGIKPIFGIDQEGGYVLRIATGTPWPGNMALGALNDAATTTKVMQALAAEVKALGIDMNFAPVADVNSNPHNPIIGIRSYSDDPQQCAAMTTAAVKGQAKSGVSSALKHFPGHGDTNVDSHTGLPCINKTLDELRACELVPFKAGIAAGADAIMTAHIQFPQVETGTAVSKSTGEAISLPATLSKALLTDLLRVELGFTGVIVTDALVMQAIADHFEPAQAMVLSLNAGADLMLMPAYLRNDEEVAAFRQIVDQMVDCVNAGELSAARLDEAVLHVLRLKQKHGLLGSTGTVNDTTVPPELVVGCQENRNLDWDVATRATTLLKNSASVLPMRLKDGQRALILVSQADKISQAELAIQRATAAGAIPAGAQVEIGCFDPDADLSIESYRGAIDTVDFVVMVCEMYDSSTLDPSGHMHFQVEAVKRVAELVHARGKKLAVISGHLPYDAAAYQDADAILACYNARYANPVPEGRQVDQWAFSYSTNVPAAICVALGAGSPQGKLPVTVPAYDGTRLTDDTLYLRGFGLSYA